jgi:hypothetical protein
VKLTLGKANMSCQGHAFVAKRNNYEETKVADSRFLSALRFLLSKEHDNMSYSKPDYQQNSRCLFAL